MIDDVRKFMLAAGQIKPEREFNVRQSALQIGLQLEEMAEKLSSIHPFKTALIVYLEYTSRGYKEGFYDGSVKEADQKSLLDADIDLMWVTIGSVLSQGADIHGAMAEVNRSNMSKLVDGKMVKDGNGKVTKPAHFSPPDLTPFVRAV